MSCVFGLLRSYINLAVELISQFWTQIKLTPGKFWTQIKLTPGKFWTQIKLTPGKFWTQIKLFQKKIKIFFKILKNQNTKKQKTKKIIFGVQYCVVCFKKKIIFIGKY